MMTRTTRTSSALVASLLLVLSRLDGVSGLSYPSDGTDAGVVVREGGGGGSGRVAGADAKPLRDAPFKPSTPVWPTVFSATLFQNRSSRLALTQLHYDWPKRRNLNVIQSQLGARGEIWDLELDNGTSYVFTRGEGGGGGGDGAGGGNGNGSAAVPPLCRILHFDVGILFPSWLADATLLGSQAADGFVTQVWSKADFIRYFNDEASGRPVGWTFTGSGAELHVMRWAPGERLLPERLWRPPAHCFTDPNATACAERGDCPPSLLDDEPLADGRLMRLPPPWPGVGEGGGGGGGGGRAAAAAVTAAWERVVADKLMRAAERSRGAGSSEV